MPLGCLATSRPAVRSDIRSPTAFMLDPCSSPMQLNRGSCRHRAARVVTCQSITEREGDLRRWVQLRGGFIHDALRLVDVAPCGARGIIAERGIGTDELFERPLALIPKTLHLENATAVRLLKDRMSASGAAGLELQRQVDELEQVQVVAAALALERRMGARSAWAPYLRMLPDDPPCPWLLDHSQIAHLLPDQEPVREPSSTAAAAAAAPSWSTGMASSAGPGSAASSTSGGGGSQGGGKGGRAGSRAWVQEWQAAAASARLRYQALAAEVVEVCGPQLGLSEEEVMWSLAQVASRSLGSGSSSGLVPFLDLLNHSPAARPPMLQLDDDDRLVMTCTNVRAGELHALAPGDELYLCYGEWACPREAWLKFGFVPQ